jgi:hypothetical protein
MDDRLYQIVDRKSHKVLAECDSLAKAQSMYTQFKAYALQTGFEIELTSRPIEPPPGETEAAP